MVSVFGASILLKLFLSDACESANFVTERRFRIGSLDAGRYELEASFCVDNPPPFPDSCTTTRVPVDVASMAAKPVPANSVYAMWLLFVFVAFLSIWAVRSRNAFRA
jgi:hypothetical protein